MKSIAENGETARVNGRASLLLLAIATALASAASFPFDHEISHWAISLEPKQPLPDLAVQAIRSLGKADTLIIALLLACLTRLRRPAVHGLVSLALIALPVLVLKLAVDRDRPTHSGDSFPSGDTASVVAALVPMALASKGWWIPVAAAAVLVASFRVLSGFHYPSDVFAGAALGFLAVWLSLRATPRKWSRPRQRVVYALLGAGILACVIADKSSGNESPLKGFAIVIVPVMLIGVILERRRLARIAKRA